MRAINTELEYSTICSRIEELLRLRMFEMELNQKKLSEMLGISTSRVSEYLNGKSEPTLKIAKDISVKLDIDPSIILGV